MRYAKDELEAREMDYKDPRGPHRQIMNVDYDPRGASTRLTLTCGHIVTRNPIFPYHVGNDTRCFECAKELKS